MHLVRPWFVVWLFAIIFAGRAMAEDAPLAARVIILANANEPQSQRLAEYYAAKRDVPPANIIALPMTSQETTTWDEFIRDIFQPLQDELVKGGWIEAIPTELRDELGRRKYAISDHRIAYLVVCRGVPLRVAHEEKYYAAVPALGGRSEFRTNASAVDSELSLLAVPNYNINAFIPNPLFGRENPTSFEEDRVVKVSRLDGPSFEDAQALIDHALEAEQYGLIGRAYVDIGGPHKMGDVWFNATARELNAANFDVSVDRGPATFFSTARFDAPALYFGWYSANVDGPFNEPEFKFPPGAVALHLHSFSATTLNATHQGWTGPLIARGVTATVGNVYEPYLEFTHQPHVIVRALLQGKTWGDAAYESMRALSWMTITIGDPLYRPFAKTFAEQWENREQLPATLYPYVVLREIHRLQHAGQADAAFKLIESTMASRPSLPLAICWAELGEAGGKKAVARKAAEWVARSTDWKPADLPLVDEAGQMLTRLDDARAAVKLYEKALQFPTLSKSFRREFLGHGMQAAAAAHDEPQRLRWVAEADKLMKGG